MGPTLRPPLAHAEVVPLLADAQRARARGKRAEAAVLLERALAANPDHPEALADYALIDAGDPQAALPHYLRALAGNPNAAAVHNNLGNLYRELRQPAEALASYRRALSLDPEHARAWSNIGNIRKDLGDADGAIDAFRRSLVLSPNRADVWSNLLLTLNAAERMTAEAVAAEHRAFGRHFAPLLPPLPPPPRDDTPLEGRRLKVGYVSADFRKHAVAAFFLPLVEAHDRTAFDVHCYYNQPRGDEVTTRIESLAEHFLPVAGMPDRRLHRRRPQEEKRQPVGRPCAR